MCKLSNLAIVVGFLFVLCVKQMWKSTYRIHDDLEENSCVMGGLEVCTTTLDFMLGLERGHGPMKESGVGSGGVLDAQTWISFFCLLRLNLRFGISVVPLEF